MKKITYIFALTLTFSLAAPAAAQGERPSITAMELNAGPRGLILTITGTGPIVLGAKPGELESNTASYPELRVNIANARSGLGQAAFAGPDQLPVREISLTESAAGVMLSIKMRSNVTGPVDVRSSNNQVRILLTREPQPQMTWSQKEPALSTAPPQSGSEIRPEPVDMKKAEERAARDVKASGGEMFTVQDAQRTHSPPQQVQQAPRVAPRTETPQVQIIEDNSQQASETISETPKGELVRYKVFGRDPFVPLVKDTASTELPRVENLRLVGVLEDYRESIALVEDFKNANRSFALRVNDPVEHGRVLRVQRDRVVFLIKDFDVSRSYVLMLTQ
ncbi:MAG: hypothetical protein FWC23_07235 [Chitinispirillia bacterium]|nr:hypothetical protein [Chitinispirillia bacterium]MCL2268962.1 hypothetical protein [Chitinispirillia bacterium]